MPGAHTAAISAAPTATGVRWRIFAILFVIVVINLVDRVALSVAMPTIAAEFALSPAFQGLVLSAFFWSYAALQIPGGWLIDRFGPRVLIAGSTVLWGFFQALAAAASGGVSLLLTRIGLGAAEAPLFPAGGKLNVAWLSARERGRGAVLMDSGSPLGAALGGIAITWLIAGLGSWRLAFLAAGLGTMAAGLLAWWYLRDHPGDHPGVNAAERARISDADLPQVAQAAPEALHTRSLVGVLVGRMGWAMVFFGIITWGPSYLAQARGLDLKQMGGATFAIFLCGAVGSLTGGFSADWLVNRGYARAAVLRAMLTVSGLATVAAFLVLPHVAEPVTAVMLLAATLFFLMWGSLYWSFPALLAPPDKVGLVGGAMNCAGSTSGIVIPILAGFILQATGAYDAVLHFFAACALAYVVGTLLIDFGRASARGTRAAGER
ncbi:MFS transporter [Methylobacterium sp. NEAU 140]|uniref:MFS transporter n=1 Tax=Methylobacterium sp. NEAU 140 TaxID=3064945 RepID=UPI0027376C4E|nr:MFS transporter [Methylobacterium sp. NEAU 140]MDP4026864.1 MFS transporter [Methylobacterium sp. NEAU 140]